MTAQQSQRRLIATITALLAAVLSVPATAAVLSVPATADVPPPPPDATAIHVSAGAETTGIDVTLPPLSFGSVSGRVLASGSRKPIGNVTVKAFFPPHRFITGVDTGADGRYRLKLPASAIGYLICYRARPNSLLPDGSIPRSGWAAECSGNEAWSGKPESVPAKADRVRVVAGQQTEHVDAVLRPGGALSGRVVRHDTGTGLPGVRVYLRSVGAPHYRDRTTTKKEGRYHFAKLPLARGGYHVCFDTQDARTFNPGRLLPAYVPRCYGTTTWPGLPSDEYPIRLSAHWPRTATRIAVRPGSARRGINATVLPAGTISGRIVDRATGHRTRISQQVFVFDDRGRLVGGAWIGAGVLRFKVRYLPTGRFHVCVAPTAGQYSTSSGTSYQRMCYRDVVWTDRASVTGGPTLQVVRGKTHRGVVLRIRHASSIRGQLTRADDGLPVFAGVSLFTSDGKFIAHAHSGFHHGRYAFINVPASRSGYLVCASAFAGHRPPTTPSVQPRCYAQGRWDGARRTPPQGATPVVVGAHDHPHADFTLPVGGTISGRLNGDSPRRAVPAQSVLFDRRGHQVASFSTYLNNNWSISGIRPSSGYQVCFRTIHTRPRFAATCYQDARWYRPYATPE